MNALLRSLLAHAFALSGCTTSLRPGPDLYDRAATSNDATRNPIIVIPGVLGTVLRDTARLKFSDVEGRFRVAWAAVSCLGRMPRSASGLNSLLFPVPADLIP